MDVLLAGDGEHLPALESALLAHGFEVHRSEPAGALAGMLMAIEEGLQRGTPRLAIGVGAGDAALALAITAPKLGIPFVAWFENVSEDRPDERRIIATLSEGSTALGGGIPEVAERIAARLGKVAPAPFAPLDSPS